MKSIAENEDDILLGIMQLHNDGQPFDLDPTFSKGSFYRTGRVPMPIHRYDLNPVIEDVIQADVMALPLADQSVTSIIFDPPFLFGRHGQAAKNPANIRYTMFDTWDDLERMYCGAMTEFRRLLKPKGIVAFKCQDYTDKVTTMTHCHVWQWATELGFYVKDLFIRYSHARIYNPALTQRHARKFHSYWFVLIPVLPWRR